MRNKVNKFKKKLIELLKYIYRIINIIALLVLGLFILEMFVKDLDILHKILDVKYVETLNITYLKKFKLESIYYISAIVSLGFIGYQVFISRKDMVMRFNYQKREKSIDMAKEFSELIDDTSLLNFFIQKSNLNKKFNESLNNYIKIKEFDVNEMKKLFGITPEEVKNALEIEKIDFKEIASMYSYINRKNKENLKNYEICKSNNFCIYSKEEIQNAEDSKKKKMEINNFCVKIIKEEVKKELQDVTTKTLNKLEWFAMNFITKIADEETVYPSLHQVYLKTIKSFYFYISSKNTNGNKDKYYGYVIQLYCLWAERYNEFMKKEIEAQEKANKILKECNAMPVINDKDLTR